ncbi:MAG: cupin [Roseivirga sp.]|nr:cupin [Roseivirga sp.]
MADNARFKGQAELLMPSADLTEDMDFFTHLGFRLDQIYPSDDPEVARMSGHGLVLKLDRSAKITAPVVHLLTDEAPAEELVAPNGTLIKFEPLYYRLELPSTQHTFEVRRLKDSAPWVIGRAGMLYRDLIPDRLGGSIIASHIRIPDAGPVPDMVHYHTIGFQLIYCYRGWVRLVYEDQGPPFILKAGDCVTQPPQIRHRVLESSENLEVIEIGVPAAHMTTIDHEMELPNTEFQPDREFGGQVFCRHELKDAQWQPWKAQGFESRDTGIANATSGVASVEVIRAGADTGKEALLKHGVDILFTFVLDGGLKLLAEGQEQDLRAGDAFVIPPDCTYRFHELLPDTQLLEVSLPG